ncbi:Peroxiredoxin-like 2A [Linum perenne]
MASFSMEDFAGNGVLKQLLPKLLEEGWDDVPTLKIMNSEDMDAMNLTRRQKDALEIRTYLHDRALMNYGDKLEASGKGLPELIALGNELASQFGMKRGHIARFLDKTNACTEPLSKSEAFPIRNPHAPSRNESLVQSFASVTSRKMPSMSRYSAGYNTSFYEKSIDQSVADFKIKDGYVFKGVVASGPAEPRACGCIAAPEVVEQVAPYSAIENITVQKLTPEYKIGMARLLKTKAPPMKVSELWRDKPAIFLCVRRPGCIMCRAEAHQLYAKKPIFDTMGIQLFAVLLEHIESEVRYKSSGQDTGEEWYFMITAWISSKLLVVEACSRTSSYQDFCSILGRFPTTNEQKPWDWNRTSKVKVRSKVDF